MGDQHQSTRSPTATLPAPRDVGVDAQAQVAFTAQRLQPAGLLGEPFLGDVDHPAPLDALDHGQLDARRRGSWRRPTPPPRTARWSRPRGSAGSAADPRRRRGARGTSRARPCRRGRPVPASWWGVPASAQHRAPRRRACSLSDLVELGVADQPASRMGPTTRASPSAIAARYSKISSNRRNRREFLPEPSLPSASTTANQRSPTRPRASTSHRLQGLATHRLDRVAADLGDLHRSSSPRYITCRSAYDEPRHGQPEGVGHGADRLEAERLPEPDRAGVGRHDGVELDRRQSRSRGATSTAYSPRARPIPRPRAADADHEGRRAHVRSLRRTVGTHLGAAQHASPRRTATTTCCPVQNSRVSSTVRGTSIV